MAARPRWKQVGWFAVLYLGGVLAVGMIAALFRVLVPH
ncbi:DUF2474 family protein [Luteibacter sp. NPDC031894]